MKRSKTALAVVSVFVFVSLPAAAAKPVAQADEAEGPTTGTIATQATQASDGTAVAMPSGSDDRPGGRSLRPGDYVKIRWNVGFAPLLINFPACKSRKQETLRQGQLVYFMSANNSCTGLGRMAFVSVKNSKTDAGRSGYIRCDAIGGC